MSFHKPNGNNYCIYAKYHVNTKSLGNFNSCKTYLAGMYIVEFQKCPKTELALIQSVDTSSTKVKVTIVL